MATDVLVSLSQLQDLVAEVQKTNKAQTIRLADGVIAVVKPAQKATARKGTAKRPKPSSSLSSRSIEEVYGAVPTPPHLRGKDIDEMIHEAKEEREVRRSLR